MEGGDSVEIALAVVEAGTGEMAIRQLSRERCA